MKGNVYLKGYLVYRCYNTVAVLDFFLDDAYQTVISISAENGTFQCDGDLGVRLKYLHHITLCIPECINIK